MTQAPAYIETDVELTDEEAEALTAKAKTIGFDLETYIRVRSLTAGDLPEPAAFFALFRSLSSFAGDYEASLRALAEQRPGAPGPPEALADTFARLLQDWDDLYGPR